MALYEYSKNAENRLAISADIASQFIIGTAPTVRRLVEELKARISHAGRSVSAAFDGYYGVKWEALRGAVQAAANDAGLKIEWIDASDLFADEQTIAAYRKPYVEIGDPGFGRVNDTGRLQDLVPAERRNAVRRQIEKITGGSDKSTAVIVCGSGAMDPDLTFDLRAYFDFTRQPMLWQMWGGELSPFGAKEPDKDYFWKDYYYCDFYLLHHHKEACLHAADFYVEAVEAANLKLLPRAAYDAIIAEAVKYPLKQVQIFQPGPWGAYRYKDLFDVPGLGCNAWNELAGPELGVLLDFGAPEMLTIPFANLMVHNKQMTGPMWAERLPGSFMLDVWLDDGYFPEPTPAERTSMPIHNHPSTDYVKSHFNEPIGRYETYYIAEAYEGANTWMGYENNCDLPEWERLCRASEKSGKPIENWKNFISAHDSAVGDLYLIPPGTTHGHGGNQMVLEMDTSVGLAGTEYSFFAYDFARPSWDDTTKTMTGKPVKLHTEHAFDNEKWYRKDWVEKNLRARPIIAKWTKEYYIDRYTSLPEMPFEIERVHFTTRGEYDTKGRFVHILTPTVGGPVTVRSIDNPGLQTTINWLQSTIIPAGFGRYELLNPQGGACTCVLIRMKEG